MSAPVRSDAADGVLVLTLDRPRVLNAVDPSMRRALIAALAAAAADDAVRAVVLTGAGDRAFTAGQDVTELVDLDAEGGAAWVRELGRLYQAFRDLEKPCVVALNGLAAGAGLQMAGHADICIAHPGVRMGQPEIDAGLPSVLGPWIMRETMGLGRAQEMSLSGRFAGADECLRVGLIDRLVAEREVLPAAIALARSLAAKPPTATRLTKRRFREVTQASWDSTVAHAASLARAAFAAGIPQQTARAFLARRTAKGS